MTKTTIKKVWAIRVGDSVELRIGAKPKTIVSKLTRLSTPPKVVYSQVTHEGGTVIGYLSAYKFIKVFPGVVVPGKDKVIELKEEARKCVCSEAWKKEHLCTY